VSTHTILVIEDEPSIRSGLRDALQSEGYGVVEAADGVKGLHAGLTQDPDLIVLDLMLPGLDGFELLRRLRADAVETPVLILTARGLEQDRLRGFELGADDYLVKPFGIPEFLARVAQRLRVWDRERGRDERGALRVGDVVVDFGARTARRGKESIGLTPKELDLLRFLAAHEGRPLARAEILEGVWGGDGDCVVSRVVDMAVSNLRRKLGNDCIEAVRSVGYRFSRTP
jgi:DNA-binding response OmpR family regulator